jgi:choline kinase
METPVSLKIGLIPASGTASRMRGLPKFLLPFENSVKTLMERHIEMMEQHVDRILIPTRPENLELIERLKFPSFVELVPLITSTMSETVNLALDKVDFELCILGMPDTYYLGQDPYKALVNLAGDVRLACWPTVSSQVGNVGSVEIVGGRVTQVQDKNPRVDFGRHWGAIAFNKSALEHLDSSTPHIGFIVNPCIEAGLIVDAEDIEGDYIDCGTFSEYRRLLSLIN